MSDYIEREKVLAEYDRQHKGPPGGARKIIETFPAADVRPVRYGKWILNDDSKTVCSLCGNVVAFVSHPDKRWDFGYYCPNCGADMRGGEAGE